LRRPRRRVTWKMSDDMARPAPPLVAVFNAADDVVRMLRQALEAEGYRTVAGCLADIQSGDFDFVAFLAEANPDVLVIDIPRPYERNLNVVRLLRAADRDPRRAWVVTTVHKPALEQLTAPLKWEGHMIGQPFGPREVVEAVRTALAWRASGA
jgi:DNA-binding NarL/FixJ family response regulator